MTKEKGAKSNLKAGTKTGRVIALLDEIRAMFEQGFKHSEVVEKLKKEHGLTMHKAQLRRVLTRFGIAERVIRDQMAGVEVQPVSHPVRSRTTRTQEKGSSEKPAPLPPPAATAPAVPVGRGLERGSAADLIAKQRIDRPKFDPQVRPKKEDVV